MRSREQTAGSLFARREFGPACWPAAPSVRSSRSRLLTHRRNRPQRSQSQEAACGPLPGPSRPRSWPHRGHLFMVRAPGCAARARGHGRARLRLEGVAGELLAVGRIGPRQPMCSLKRAPGSTWRTTIIGRDAARVFALQAFLAAEREPNPVRARRVALEPSRSSSLPSAQAMRRPPPNWTCRPSRRRGMDGVFGWAPSFPKRSLAGVPARARAFKGGLPTSFR